VETTNQQGEAFRPGSSFQQYEIVRLVGAGYNGEVYEVIHRHHGGHLALKVLHLADRRDAKKVQRALSTAKGAFDIQHVNVTKVHDFGCEPDGMVWILMDLLRGLSLRTLIGRYPSGLSAPFAVAVAIEVAWGLDAAHEVGVIHRDIKPDNVFLTSDNVVKLLDFALAKVIPEGVQTTKRTSGAGTVPYMAPEHLRGEDPDARIDLYALGMMLFEMLVGYHPFHDTMHDMDELIRRQLYVEPGPLPARLGLPPYVDTFFTRALAKDPAKRFLSAGEMARALMNLRDRLAVDAGARLILLPRPPGEPPFPGSPLARADHRAGIPTPELDPPPSEPKARVVVTAPRLSRLAGTLPLGSANLADLVPSAPPELPRPSPPRQPHRSVPRAALSLVALAILLTLGSGLAIARWLWLSPIHADAKEAAPAGR
jgi:serine/threonine-protein kinase